MQIGIDFGTTNTVAAIIGPDGKPVVLPLDPEAPESGTLRTLLYVERDGLIHIGSEAMRLHRDQNVGRIPRFAKAWVGVIDIEMGDAVVKGFLTSAAIVRGRPHPHRQTPRPTSPHP